MPYTISDLAMLHSREGQTIRTWSIEFSEYLSPTANPGENKTRLFSVEDARKIALIADYRKRRRSADEIVIALRSGELGDMPEFEPEELQELDVKSIKQRAELQIEALQYKVLQLNDDRENALQLAEQAQQYREKVIELEATLKAVERQFERQLERIERRLEDTKEKDIQIGGLQREIGRLQGELDALRRQQDNE